jgi:hypothetical protein
MTRLHAAPAALVSGLLLLAGCTTMEPGPKCDMGRVNSQRELVPGPAMVEGSSSPLKEMPANSVSMVDPDIINKLYVRTIAARRTASGTVEVAAQVVNCTDYPLNAEARTQFTTSAGTPAEPVSAWRRFHLPAHTINTYSEFSLGTEAVDGYLIEMRETK